MLFYDFEVFKYDWLVVIYDDEQDATIKIHNDARALSKAITPYQTGVINDLPVWTGFNNAYYDNYIFAAILADWDNESIKQLSDNIITDSTRRPWTYGRSVNWLGFKSFDVLQHLAPPAALKVLEGLMGHDIRETETPFDIDRPLTPEELERAFYYCSHDVMETREIFKRVKPSFDTMCFFIDKYRLPASYIGMTKARLAATILRGNKKGAAFADEFEFTLLDCLDLGKYEHVKDWYLDPAHYTRAISGKRQSFETMIAGVKHTLAWGGLHGGLESYNADGLFLNIDVTAYYPSLQVVNGFGRRVMGSWERFQEIHNSNLDFKRAGDKAARQPFKILDNSISGCHGFDSSLLFDPRSNHEICINGQLLLVDLIAHIEDLKRGRLIQSNTDGIIWQIDSPADVEPIRAVVAAWERKTGLNMEIEQFNGSINQKDVNNYFLIDRTTGKYKSKGARAGELSDIDKGIPILNKALIALFRDNTPIETTISNSTDLRDFQVIAHASSKFKGLEWGGEPLREKTVRAFASTDETDGGLTYSPLSVEYNKDGTEKKHKKVPDTPNHGFLMNCNVCGAALPSKLDKSWYVAMAKRWAVDFFGDGSGKASAPKRSKSAKDAAGQARISDPPADVDAVKIGGKAFNDYTDEEIIIRVMQWAKSNGYIFDYESFTAGNAEDKASYTARTQGAGDTGKETSVLLAVWTDPPQKATLNDYKGAIELKWSVLTDSVMKTRKDERGNADANTAEYLKARADELDARRKRAAQETAKKRAYLTQAMQRQPRLTADSTGGGVEYLRAKKVLDIAIEADPNLYISSKGALIVPYFLGDEITTFQTITKAGKGGKFWLKGYDRATGRAFHPIKAKGKSNGVILCEGLATGLAVWKLTEGEFDIAVCGDISGVKATGQRLITDTNIKIIIAVDNDAAGTRNAGLDGANAVKSIAPDRVYLLIPEPIDGKKTDWNDVLCSQ